jgi:hypothetical protein
MVCCALSGPEGAANAGAAKPMTAAARPLAIDAVANPNFCMMSAFFPSSSRGANDAVRMMTAPAFLAFVPV